ncbi:hypothetical protein KBC03_08105 [Patescibacteria group bacterium]|nr:hypothetical protein [Patescibacteria group bacterium]
MTKFVLAASDFMIASWRWLAIVITGGVIAYRFLYKHVLLFKIFIDDVVLKIPAVKDTIKTFYLYRFSKLLGDFYNA